MNPERPEFDEEFYLRQYPDIAASGMDPYEHFIHFGIDEGRLGARPVLRRIPGLVPYDRARETVLVVSHDASMTGAPILSLNLVRGLQQTYNVVALLLGGGPLVGAFRDACVMSVEPLARRHHAALASDTIAQLAPLYGFRFAVVNSVESALVLEPLARSNIPTLALIHEFAAYTRPRALFQAAFAWASEVVFSTQITYQDVLEKFPELQGRACRFLPQGRCTLLAHEPDGATVQTEMERIRSTLRPSGLPEDTIVVIGIGSVHIRKGVELFIDCAARVIQGSAGKRFRFVWVGGGLDPENDVDYSVFLFDQIRRAGLDQVFEFMDNTQLVEEIYKLADIFLLTSRLDPLPGVAIEAMSHRLPVVCFDRTTGIAEVLTQHGLGLECVVPYLDTTAMASRVMDYAQCPPLRTRVGDELQAVAGNYFDMDCYIERIDRLGRSAVARAPCC